MDTYAIGVAVVTGVVFSVLFAIAATELVFEFRGVASLAERVQHWGHKNRYYVSVLLLIWSTLLAHFVLNPLQPR